MSEFESFIFDIVVVFFPQINLNGRVAKSRLGSYYARLPDGGRSVLGPNVRPPPTRLPTCPSFT